MTNLELAEAVLHRDQCIDQFCVRCADLAETFDEEEILRRLASAVRRSRRSVEVRP